MMTIIDLPERIARYAEPEPYSGCWLWAGCTDRGGYPKTGKGQLVLHRALYEMYIDGIPEAHDVHHRCRTRACINPAHMECLSKLAHHKLRLIEQTHCKRGHRLSDDNVWYRANGRRICKACTRAKPYYNR